MKAATWLRSHGKAGYSLVEMVFVSLLGSLVLGQVLVALIWGQRIYRDVIATSELTTASRMLKERTLYHLVKQTGGLASLDLQTCSIGTDSREITFSIGNEKPRYQLSFDPRWEESGLDLQKTQDNGTDESAFAWSPLHAIEIDEGSEFRLFRQDPGKDVRLPSRKDKDFSKRYYLSNAFQLSLVNAGHRYVQPCLIRSPVVNDFAK